MSARRERARKRQRTSPTKPKPSASVSTQQKSSASSLAHSALDNCVGAVCLVEVTLHSLESQEIAFPEQEVLKRALKAMWFVHDWIDDMRPDDEDDEDDEDADREDES